MWLRNVELVSWLWTDVVSSRHFSYNGDSSDMNCFIIKFYFYFSWPAGYPEKVNNL